VIRASQSRPNRDALLRKEAAEHLHELLRMGPVREQEVLTCALVAFQINEHHLAIDLANQADRLGVGNTIDLHLLRMKANADIGNLAGAIESADKVLAKDPRDELALLDVRRP